MQTAKKQANLALILLSLLFALSFAFASTPGNISACTVIDTPGTYNLTADATSQSFECIKILTSNVTINGNGHTIRGPVNRSSDIYGIWMSSVTNITINNLKIFDFGTGIGILNTANSTFSQISLLNNSEGIYISNGANLTFNDLNSLNTLSGDGIRVDASNNPIQFNNVRISGGTPTNGMLLYNTSSVTVSGLYASNSIQGILLSNSRANTFVDITCESNNYPIALTTFANENTFNNLTLTNNTASLLILNNSNNNSFYNVKVSGDSPGSFYSDGALQNTVENLNIYTRSAENTWWVFNSGGTATEIMPYITYTNMTLGNQDGSVKASQVKMFNASRQFIWFSDINITKNYAKIKQM